VVDSGDQVFDAPEAPSSNRLLRNETEPSLDLIEPGRIGGRVMDVKARSLCQPNSNVGMLVGGIVVDDEMDGKIVGHGFVDSLEEAKKLLMSVAWFAFGEDGPGGDVEGGKKGGGAMANVVMSDAFHVAQAHR
jgi:hypothetical protein